MFQLPALVTISICATRMYRSLGDFVVAHTDLYCNTSILSLLALTAVDLVVYRTAPKEVVLRSRRSYKLKPRQVSSAEQK
jgi:hypothetical protein